MILSGGKREEGYKVGENNTNDGNIKLLNEKKDRRMQRGPERKRNV